MNKRVGVAADQSEKVIKEMQDLMKATDDRRLRERYQIILMIVQGKSYSDISEMVGKSIPSLYNYARAYRENGVEGLTIKYAPGPTPKLTTEQETLLIATIINKTPADVGFQSEMNWTSSMICQWIKNEFDVQFSDRGT